MSIYSSAVDPIAVIVSNPKWLLSLHQWHQAGGVFRNLGSSDSMSGLESWQALEEHLVRTKRFKCVNGGLLPTKGGRELLTRMSELYRAIRREYVEDKLIVEILERLPRGAAADIGCGSGYSSLQLVRLGYTPVHSFDTSKTALEVARTVLEREGRNSFLHDEDATRLSAIESESLALIYSRTALQYFRQAELAKAFNRTLRRGGHVVAEMIGLHYYLQRKHLRKLLKREWQQPLSYFRTVLRTMIYETLTFQPQLAAAAPEIGFTRRSIERLASWSGLELVTVAPAPSLVGYLVVMRKPV